MTLLAGLFLPPFSGRQGHSPEEKGQLRQSQDFLVDIVV
jgi:hypothetical protein